MFLSTTVPQPPGCSGLAFASTPATQPLKLGQNFKAESEFFPGEGEGVERWEQALWKRPKAES